MIEVALDAAQNFVIDDILIAQLNNRPALHIERVLLQSLLGGREQSIRAISARTRAYDPDLKIFLDQSGKITGKYYDDSGLEIDIKR